jgi:signal transduction histidine kinase
MGRILVVDDQKISRLTLAAILGEAGHTVRAEAGGPAGIEAARSWIPDVIILDVHMPEMDGFEVVERLKKDPLTEAIPVVFLTGDPPTDQLIVRGLELGAYDFLSKGCSKAELLARVGVMERIKRGHDELAAVARISDALLQKTDAEAVARQFIRDAAHVFRADAVLLSVAREGHRPLLVGRGLDGSGPEDLSAMLRALSGRLDHAEGARAVVLTQDEVDRLVGAHVDDRFVSAAFARVRRGAGTACVAILARAVGHYRSDVDAPLLRTLSSQVSVAIEHALLNDRARRQARDLERAMSERSRFFASLSHELRTPINAVIGYNHLLQEEIFGALNERQADALGKANRSAQHLLELVDDILDISKIEAGKLEILPEDVDLAALLRDTATSLQIQAMDKGIELVTDVEGRAPVVTDPARVRQIVLNLLSNAVKFTADGQVLLRLDRPAAGGGYGVVVSDTGPGIALADRERIFEEFEQGPAAAGATGTGLGLAISRRLAELLGGSLTVDSELGVGSAFTLRLPLRAPAQQEDGGEEQRPGGEGEEVPAEARVSAPTPLPRDSGG